MSEQPVIYTPTISVRRVRYKDGSCAVELTVTGLASDQHADAVISHLQRLLFGEEIQPQ